MRSVPSHVLLELKCAGPSHTHTLPTPDLRHLHARPYSFYVFLIAHTPPPNRPVILIRHLHPRTRSNNTTHTGLLDILPIADEADKLRLAASFPRGQPLHHDPPPQPTHPPLVPLHETEQFMLHTLRVPRLAAKVQALHFVLGWQEGARALVAKMEALQRAFADVMRSGRLVRLLELLLMLANTLNAYSGTGSACVVETSTLESLFRVRF